MHTENSFLKLQSTCDIWIWRLNCLVYAWNRMNPCRTSCISLHPLHHEGLWTLEQVYELAQLPVVDENVKYLRRFQVNWAVTKYITYVCVSSKQKKKTFTSLKVSVVNNNKKEKKSLLSQRQRVCLPKTVMTRKMDGNEDKRTRKELLTVHPSTGLECLSKHDQT